MNERLKQIIEYYGITPHRFSKEVGLSEGTIRKVLSENTSLKSENLQKMSQTFPDINLDWLITGRGSMFLNETKHFSNAPSPSHKPDVSHSLPAKSSNDNADHLQQLIREKEARIASLVDLVEAQKEIIRMIGQKSK